MFTIPLLGDQALYVNYILACMKDTLLYAFHIGRRVRRLPIVYKRRKANYPEGRLKMDGVKYV